MDKGKSDRTEEPGGGEKIPATDATSGGETLDDASGNKPFRPGQPEKYPPKKSNDMDPESMGSPDEGNR